MDIGIFSMIVLYSVLPVAVIMLLVIRFMGSKEQRNSSSAAILIQAVATVIILFVILRAANSSFSAIVTAPSSKAAVTSLQSEKVVEQSVPFAKSAEEDGKSSKAGEKPKPDNSSLFGLVDEGADGYFAIDGVPYFNYQIEPGDNVFKISQKFGIEMAELKARNGLEGEHPVIIAGKFLKIPIE